MRPIKTTAILIVLALTACAGPVRAATSAELLPSLSPMLERVSPGVVNIAVRGKVTIADNPLFQDPFFRRFFDLPEMPRERETQSVGSGVIIDARKGYVATNHHVIAEAEEISIVLADRRRLDAEVVGSDPEADIAVLKVEPEDLTAVPFGDSDKLKVGDFVVAIGNPFGIGQTATLGIVSALGRTGLGIEGYESFIQTDASINPGNSGGALVDQQGRLVGINTAILSRGGGNIGIGFAIPVNMARHLIDQLIAYGEVRRGLLGVLIQDLTPDIAEAMRVEADGGAVVSRVVPDSPAQEAGLKAGDVILSLDGKAVASSAELRNRIGLMNPGQKVELGVVRKGRRLTVKATLGEAKQAQAALDGGTSKLAGAKLAEIPPEHPLYGQVEGVLVRQVEPGSKAARAGLRPGDIIDGADQQPISGLEDLAAILRDHDDKPLLLHVRRGQGALFLSIR
jgi:serine protease Do/serine protease DegQ